ncbi:hypothetical protein FH972_023297 [Carpinus fangiana]|uniref:Uncharacterized protein n=1 Tax=Carpinus fangiana TaxID=176857 RepID=A0A5N6KV19_9ROSI|nr:hypothetical protein FH972_023297 [Carpinus fangiana]
MSHEQNEVCASDSASERSDSHPGSPDPEPAAPATGNGEQPAPTITDNESGPSSSDVDDWLERDLDESRSEGSLSPSESSLAGIAANNFDGAADALEEPEGPSNSFSDEQDETLALSRCGDYVGMIWNMVKADGGPDILVNVVQYSQQKKGDTVTLREVARRFRENGIHDVDAKFLYWVSCQYYRRNSLCHNAYRDFYRQEDDLGLVDHFSSELKSLDKLPAVMQGDKEAPTQAQWNEQQSCIEELRSENANMTRGQKRKQDHYEEMVNLALEVAPTEELQARVKKLKREHAKALDSGSLLPPQEFPTQE